MNRTLSACVVWLIASWSFASRVRILSLSPFDAEWKVFLECHATAVIGCADLLEAVVCLAPVLFVLARTALSQRHALAARIRGFARYAGLPVRKIVAFVGVLAVVFRVMTFIPPHHGVAPHHADAALSVTEHGRTTSSDANGAHVHLGCDVCATPDVFNFEMPSETAANVVCQSFWHKHYADWKACRAAALIERAAFRRELCSRCTAQADSASPPASLLQPPTRGIAFGVTGTGVAYIKMIAVAIVQLRSPLIGYSEGIEVFVDSEPLRELCVKVIAPHGAKCKILTVKVRIGFAAKLIAARESSFDEVMMLDADTLFVMNPSALFNDAAFRMHGVLMWSDYFGNG